MLILLLITHCKNPKVFTTETRSTRRKTLRSTNQFFGGFANNGHDLSNSDGPTNFAHHLRTVSVNFSVSSVAPWFNFFRLDPL